MEQLERLFSILVHARVRGRDIRKRCSKCSRCSKECRGVQGGGGVYGGMIVAIGAKSYTIAFFRIKNLEIAKKCCNFAARKKKHN